MNQIRIGELQYLNCAPFYWRKPRIEGVKFDWIECHPNRMGELARQGKLDSGPFSLADTFGMEKEFEPLGELGISSPVKAESVILCSKKAISGLAHGRVGLTPNSVTSSLLIRILLTQKYKLQVRFTSGFEVNDDARLFIGDEALKNRSRSQYPFLYDLGEEWSQWQSLPFVFARWMVRKSLALPAKKQLLGSLSNNIEEFKKDPQKAILWFSKKTGSSYANAKNYLLSFNYRFGARELKAIQAFKRLSAPFRKSALVYQNK